MQKISVPSRLWYENAERVLTFPERWEVDDLESPGFRKPGLSSEQIRERIARPIEGPTLEELAQGRRQAAVVFDDMTRPTPVRDVAPHVLEALQRAGMKREAIRFIWALGAHGAYDMINARKKLGDAVVENYAVFNHDPFQNTVALGRTPTGVELWYNREFMDCDLKIGIGCITPHVHVGFGGGAKIILPGVAGIETINQFHNQLYRDRTRVGLGNFEDNIMRAECDAAGDLVGLNFKVDCMINRRGQITELFAGPFRATHAAGAEAGREHYGLPRAEGYDIAVCNTYAKANESAIALGLGLGLIRPGEGTAVLITDAPEGQVVHYVFGPWGTEYGGRHFSSGLRDAIPHLVRKLIILDPLPSRVSLGWFARPDNATVVKSWPEVLAILERDYPGEARVAVLQDGTMQYFRSP